MTAAGSRHGKTETQDASDAPSRVNRRLQREFLRLAHLETATRVHVFAFRVLSDDHQIDVAWSFTGKRTPHTRQQASRSNAGVLIKGLADTLERIERDMVRNPV